MRVVKKRKKKSSLDKYNRGRISEERKDDSVDSARDRKKEVEGPRRKSTLTIPSIEKRQKICMRFIELLLNPPSPKSSSSSSSSRDGRIGVARSIKQKKYLPIVRLSRISQHTRDNQCQEYGAPYSIISVVSCKSRIRATVSSNLSSSSSNLALFGTAVRLSEQINLRRDCIVFEKRETRAFKKKKRAQTSVAR